MIDDVDLSSTGKLSILIRAALSAVTVAGGLFDHLGLRPMIITRRVCCGDEPMNRFILGAIGHGWLRKIWGSWNAPPGRGATACLQVVFAVLGGRDRFAD